MLLGAELKKLENNICKKYKRKYAVGVGSATDGLYFSMKALGLNRSSTIVCPALSYVATAGAGAVTVGAAVWPLVNQMNPSADVQALASIPVDVSGVSEGTQLTVLFQGKPVFVRRRTAEEIEALMAA